MKTRKLSYVLFLLMSILGYSQDIQMLIQQGDTAFVVPLERIKQANLKFLEGEKYKELYGNQLEITVNLEEKVMVVEQKYLNEKEKTAILEAMLSNQEAITEQTESKLEKERTKTKRANLRTIGAVIITVLVLLV